MHWKSSEDEAEAKTLDGRQHPPTLRECGRRPGRDVIGAEPPSPSLSSLLPSLPFPSGENNERGNVFKLRATAERATPFVR